jgi:Spy/CpxP family protein refolding chaperone
VQHWKTAFLTLVIFGLGGVAGGMITARVIKSRIEQVKVTTPGGGVTGDAFVPNMLGVMQRQLNLTPEQTENVREIMLRTQREIVRSREEQRLKSRNIMERSDAAVMAILTDEQKAKYGEVKNRRAAILRPRPPNGLPPPRPGDRPGDPPRHPPHRPPPPNHPPEPPPPGSPPPAQPLSPPSPREEL